MPKYNFMISKAVDLVARKLAGLDTDTITRLTQILNEEAQVISEELQNSGESVNVDVLAARLEGVVARMKYEVRNQGPDPSPYEFPIFNVSHNPGAPYPNPINHLYDKRYKEAYSTFIKQNQPPVPKTPPASSSAPAHQAFARNQYQPSNIGWGYMNPYATMPRSQAAHYQQQAAKLLPTIQEQSITNNNPPMRRSSTLEDLSKGTLSRSTTGTDLNYSSNSGPEKIRVRVINDRPVSSSIALQPNATNFNNIYASQKSILKQPINPYENRDVAGVTKRIYASSNTDIGNDTLQDLFKVVNNQQEPAQSISSPIKERIIIIDRRNSNSLDENLIPPSQDRVRTFEVRTTNNEPGSPEPTSSASGATSTTKNSIVTPTPTLMTSPSSNNFIIQQPTYFPGQQFYYQQPKLYPTTSYIPGVNNYYPYGFYPY